MSDDRIVKYAERGEMIALCCKNHPTLRWMTKNIAPIGCRTIFYNLHNDPDMGRECDCRATDLEPVVE